MSGFAAPGHTEMEIHRDRVRTDPEPVRRVAMQARNNLELTAKVRNRLEDVLGRVRGAGPASPPAGAVQPLHTPPLLALLEMQASLNEKILGMLDELEDLV